VIIYNFSEIDSFLSNFNPLSQYGKLYFNKKKYFTNYDSLIKEYDLIDLLSNYIVNTPHKVSFIENCLKKIAVIPINDAYGFADIFLFKKFLNNYKKIIDSLNNEIVQYFNFYFVSDELLNYLNIDSNDENSFYLSNSYSLELKNLREQISILDNKIAKLKNDWIKIIEEKFDLSFKYQDFIIIPDMKAKELDKSYFYYEAYDAENLIVKINYPSELFDYIHEKDEIYEKIKLVEEEVINNISNKILQNIDDIKNYSEIITKFDILLAKAQFCLKYHLKRPQLLKDEFTISVKNGNFIPLQNKCSDNQTKYTPLNCKFTKKVNIINGSNMGGKTILLKSLTFLQYLAQMGFFVPCDEFITVIFDNFNFIGEVPSSENVEGLSSFGLEINSFNEFLNNIGNMSFVIMDEFARTTNSIEAKALLNAIIDYFSQHHQIVAFISTHFMDLKRFDKVGYYRMKGLNYEEFKKSYIDHNLTLKERIKLINNFMDYNIVENEENIASYDALKISKIIGLKEDIINLANKYLEM